MACAPQRRSVHRSAVTTFGLAAGLSIARGAHAAGREPFRVVLIGAGGRGTGATADCLNVAGHIRLVAIADAFADRAALSRKLLSENFPQQVDVPPERIFVGWDAYRQALACDAELAILATPPGFRPGHYQAAVAAGRHVFMEKPLCVDAPGFRAVMATNQAAQERGLKVGVGLFRRHNPSYVETIRQIHDGQIGQVLLLRCSCNMTRWGHFTRKPGMSEMEYQVRGWRCVEWLSGGRLVEAHCHELDVMDWVMGGHPLEANGMGGRQATPPGMCAYDYDHHFHEYTYADGTKMYSQSRSVNGAWQDITEHVHGSRGVVDLCGKIIKINDFQRREAVNPYRLEHQHLLDAIWNNKPYHEGWIGATASFTAILGREAAYSGQVVRWDDLAAKGRSLFPDKLAWDAEPPVMPDQAGSYDHAVPVPGLYRPW